MAYFVTSRAKTWDSHSHLSDLCDSVLTPAS